MAICAINKPSRETILSVLKHIDKIGSNMNYLNEKPTRAKYIKTMRRDQQTGFNLIEYYKSILAVSEGKRSEQIALIVPYEYLSKLNSVFGPGKLRIGRFESLYDFYVYKRGYLPYSNFKPRHQYTTVLDLSYDTELWENTTPIFAKPSKEMRPVDILVHAETRSTECHVMCELASRMWIGSQGTPGYWETPGVRTKDVPHNPHILLAESISGFRQDVPSYMLAYRGTGDEDDWRDDRTTINMSTVELAKQQVREVCDYLQTHCNGCGWFTGTPQISFLGHPDRTKPNVLTNPGDEWQYVLPVDAQQVRDSCIMHNKDMWL